MYHPLEKSLLIYCFTCQNSLIVLKLVGAVECLLSGPSYVVVNRSEQKIQHELFALGIKAKLKLNTDLTHLRNNRELT